MEKIGVERTRESIDEADLIIAMFDASLPFEEEDKEILDSIRKKKVLNIVNKIDMPILLDVDKIRKFAPHEDIIEISIKEGKGIDKIEDYIYNMVYQ